MLTRRWTNCRIRQVNLLLPIPIGWPPPCYRLVRKHTGTSLALRASYPSDEIVGPPTARVLSARKRALIVGYLVLFCLLHSVSIYETVRRIADQERLSWLHIFSCAVPLLAATSISLYGLGVQPRRYIRFWQAVPHIVVIYALMAFRVVYDDSGTSLVSVEFIASIVLGVILYSPAVYMSHRLVSSLNYWDAQLQLCGEPGEGSVPEKEE